MNMSATTIAAQAARITMASTGTAATAAAAVAATTMVSTRSAIAADATKASAYSAVDASGTMADVPGVTKLTEVPPGSALIPTLAPIPAVTPVVEPEVSPPDRTGTVPAALQSATPAAGEQPAATIAASTTTKVTMATTAVATPRAAAALPVGCDNLMVSTDVQSGIGLRRSRRQALLATLKPTSPAGPTGSNGSACDTSAISRKRQRQRTLLSSYVPGDYYQQEFPHMDCLVNTPINMPLNEWLDISGCTSCTVNCDVCTRTEFCSCTCNSVTAAACVDTSQVVRDLNPHHQRIQNPSSQNSVQSHAQSEGQVQSDGIHSLRQLQQQSTQQQLLHEQKCKLPSPCTRSKRQLSECSGEQRRNMEQLQLHVPATSDSQQKQNQQRSFLQQRKQPRYLERLHRDEITVVNDPMPGIRVDAGWFEFDDYDEYTFSYGRPASPLDESDPAAAAATAASRGVAIMSNDLDLRVEDSSENVGDYAALGDATIFGVAEQTGEWEDMEMRGLASAISASLRKDSIDEDYVTRRIPRVVLCCYCGLPLRPATIASARAAFTTETAEASRDGTTSELTAAAVLSAQSACGNPVSSNVSVLPQERDAAVTDGASSLSLASSSSTLPIIPPSSSVPVIASNREHNREPLSANDMKVLKLLGLDEWRQWCCCSTRRYGDMYMYKTEISDLPKICVPKHPLRILLTPAEVKFIGEFDLQGSSNASLHSMKNSSSNEYENNPDFVGFEAGAANASGHNLHSNIGDVGNRCRSTSVGSINSTVTSPHNKSSASNEHSKINTKIEISNICSSGQNSSIRSSSHKTDHPGDMNVIDSKSHLNDCTSNLMALSCCWRDIRSGNGRFMALHRLQQWLTKHYIEREKKKSETETTISGNIKTEQSKSEKMEPQQAKTIEAVKTEAPQIQKCKTVKGIPVRSTAKTTFGESPADSHSTNASCEQSMKGGVRKATAVRRSCRLKGNSKPAEAEVAASATSSDIRVVSVSGHRAQTSATPSAGGRGSAFSRRLRISTSLIIDEVMNAAPPPLASSSLLSSSSASVPPSTASSSSFSSSSSSSLTMGGMTSETKPTESKRLTKPSGGGKESKEEDTADSDVASDDSSVSNGCHVLPSIYLDSVSNCFIATAFNRSVSKLLQKQFSIDILGEACAHLYACKWIQWTYKHLMLEDSLPRKAKIQQQIFGFGGGMGSRGGGRTRGVSNSVGGTSGGGRRGGSSAWNGKIYQRGKYKTAMLEEEQLLQHLRRSAGQRRRWRLLREREEAGLQQQTQKTNQSEQWNHSVEYNKNKQNASKQQQQQVQQIVQNDIQLHIQQHVQQQQQEQMRMQQQLKQQLLQKQQN